MSAHIETRPQGETNLDPGSPSTREPKGTGEDRDAPINPWDAAVFLNEAFHEVLAEYSESDQADLARVILQGDECAVGHALTQKVAEYMRDQVNDVRMGYVPRRVR